MVGHGLGKKQAKKNAAARVLDFLTAQEDSLGTNKVPGAVDRIRTSIPRRPSVPNRIGKNIRKALENKDLSGAWKTLGFVHSFVVVQFRTVSVMLMFV
jgi:hypothetical protein